MQLFYACFAECIPFCHICVVTLLKRAINVCAALHKTAQLSYNINKVQNQ